MLLCILQIFGCLCAPILIVLTVNISCYQIAIVLCCCCIIINISSIIVLDAIVSSLFGMCVIIIIFLVLMLSAVFVIMMLTVPLPLNIWRNLPLRLTYPEITYLIERYCRMIMFRISQLNVFFTPFSLVENIIWNILKKKWG